MNMQVGPFKPPSLDDSIYEINIFDSSDFKNKIGGIALSNEEYQREKGKGTFKNAAPYPHNPFLVTIYRGSCLDYLKDLTLPSTFHLAARVHHKALRAFATLFTAIADLITFPIRLLTAPFFCRVRLPQKESHPLYKLLKEKGVSQEILDKKIKYIEIYETYIEKNGHSSDLLRLFSLPAKKDKPSLSFDYSTTCESINLEPTPFNKWNSYTYKKNCGSSTHYNRHKESYLKLHKGISEQLYDELLAGETRKAKQKPISHVLEQLKPHLKESSYNKLKENQDTDKFPKLLKRLFYLECHPDKNKKIDQDTFNRLKEMVEPLYT